jgi:UDP-glucose 4-epimerase
VFSRVGEAREGDVAIAYADPHKAKELLWRTAQKTIEDAVTDARQFIQKNI